MTFDPVTAEAALDEAAEELDAVDAALIRLEDGTFEKCSVCAGPIDRDRLLQDPLLTRCAGHEETV
jgi:RNA polymerase-binding transcription factor DksA